MKRLVYLYPPEWRDRYGEEFSALLEARPVTPLDLLDIIRGALDAHLHPQVGGERSRFMQNSLRNSILIGFCAYIGFVVAGLALYGMVDDSGFVAPMRQHLLFRLSWLTIEGGSALALLAVVAGGAPIVLTLLREAFVRRRKDLFWLLAVPLLSLFTLVVIYGGTIIGWQLLYGGGQLPVIIRQIWSGLFVLAAMASTAGVCIALVRGKVNLNLYRLALLPAALATFSMLLMLVGTVAWGFLASQLLPREFANEALVWFGIVGIMTAASCVAVKAVLYGFSFSITLPKSF
jgi:hypothetical protein